MRTVFLFARQGVSRRRHRVGTVGADGQRDGASTGTGRSLTIGGHVQ